jgi:predicted permease
VRIAPFSYRGYSSAPIAVDGYEAQPDEPPNIDYDEVGPGYFATIGMPLVSGREFTRADDERSEPVVVVNEAMVEKFWRGQDPTNRRLVVRNRPMRVVGVAKTSKYRNLLEPPTPLFYVPLRQSDKVVGQGLIIRTRLRPEQATTVLAREVRALDANLAPSEVISMREQIDRTMSSQTMAVTLLTVFGGLALVLAAVGLYGVMSSAVSQSHREFGLRLALGASATDLLGLVMTRGLALSATGLALGGLAALALTRLLGSLLYNVSPRDPVSYAVAFLVMAIAVALACIVPAWRASRADPLVTLRG